MGEVVIGHPSIMNRMPEPAQRLLRLTVATACVKCAYVNEWEVALEPAASLQDRFEALRHEECRVCKGKDGT